MRKKSVYSLLICVMVVTLVACSHNNENSNQSTSSSLQQESSQQPESSSSAVSSQSSLDSSLEQTKEEKKAMDISALVNGDYSGIEGTWQNAAGNQLVFDDKGLVSDSYELYGASLTDYGTASGGVYGGETGGFLLEFIPKGVKIADKENFQDNSDTARDRIWAGVGMNTFDEQGTFYYRISE